MRAVTMREQQFPRTDPGSGELHGSMPRSNISISIVRMARSTASFRSVGSAARRDAATGL